jgi:class 3 adenylate cyclase/TolB-like protein/Tfp pilus assembly protein PilF
MKYPASKEKLTVHAGVQQSRSPRQSKHPAERRLAAIMFTDMVGYTSSAQRDESLALESLKRHRETLRACLNRHNGREIKTMGDGFLVEFASALEAANCALDIQRSLRQQNTSLSPASRIQLRIGVHAGDVIHDRGDVFGDAVNVASRIERLAGPGEVCITQQVFDHIRNKLASHAEYIGKVSLKNVELPVEVYRLSLQQTKAPYPVPKRVISHRVVILPLANISPNTADEYFADGMTEELISSVSKIRDIRVISRTSSMKFKGSGKTIKEIAKELNVDTVLEGSVRKSGSKLRINVQLVDVELDEHVWAQSYDRELEDIFAIQSDIASNVADAMKVNLLAAEKENIEKKATESIPAYNLYLKGLHYRGEKTESGFRKAIQYFNEALKKDSRFALAYAGLAECYAALSEDGVLPADEGYPKAKALALKALKIQSDLSEAHATLGTVLADYDWDFRGAEEEFKRALGLNPNFGRVCNSYGALLACEGRLEEAIVEIKRAQLLNPLALEVNNCASVIYNCANQYDKSLETCQLMLRIDEEYFPAYQNLAETYLHKSMFPDAIKALEKAMKLSNGAATVKGRLGYAHAISGNTAEARTTLLELENDSKSKYVSPVAFALVHCGLGNKEQAIEWLERAYEEHAGGLISLKVRPLWASLHSVPRFKKLLKKMGLDE